MQSANNSWPLANFQPLIFSKMANQISAWCIHFVSYIWPIKFMKNQKNGQPFQVSYFALYQVMLPLGFSLEAILELEPIS